MVDKINFDEGVGHDKKHAYLDELSEKRYYNNVAEQIKNDPHIKWGDGLSVLIISDRCPGRARGLREYLFEKTDLTNVMFMTTFDDAKEYISSIVPDILIFVGYQENDINYKVQDIVLEKNPDVFIMIYALLDECIKLVCADKKINHAFSSSKPVTECVAYIKGSYSFVR